MIGGGSPRVLRLAGREADIVSINFNNKAGKMDHNNVATLNTADGTHRKIGWIKEGAGDRFDEIEIETGIYFASLTDNQQGAAEALGKELGMDVDTVLNFPHALIGSVDYMCEELERRRELYGINYFSFLDRCKPGLEAIVARLAGK